MPRDKRPPEARIGAHPLKIRWAPRLTPSKLQRLYESDARGIHDLELCQDVGLWLWERCRTYVLVDNREVQVPAAAQSFASCARRTSPF
jgi:hypothetical protein